MREYFATLFFVCILSGVIGAISPSECLGKHLEYLCALCVICCMAIPIGNILPTVESLFDTFDGYVTDEQSYEEIYRDFFEAEDERAIAEALSAGLAQRLGASEEDFRVELCVSEAEGVRELLGVRLYIVGLPAVSADPEIIREYFAGTAGVDCEIVYDIGKSRSESPS